VKKFKFKKDGKWFELKAADLEEAKSFVEAAKGTDVQEIVTFWDTLKKYWKFEVR
jgi:predicted enzyme related to lactoylglutathione lyase